MVRQQSKTSEQAELAKDVVGNLQVRKSTLSKIDSEPQNIHSSSQCDSNTPGKYHGSTHSNKINPTKRNFKPGPKARRDKKHVTAAQNLGKVTGRWTDEEHKRFRQGK